MAQLAQVQDDQLVPPQNLQAEEHVLGSIMLSPAAVETCRTLLRPDGREFYRESHARIWRAALRLADRGEPVDVITLTDELEQLGQLEDAGGRVRLHELGGLVPASANVGHYAKIVVEQAQRRDLIRLGAEISRLGWETAGEATDLVERARTLADQLDDISSCTSPLEIETWAQFERSATEQMPMLVDALWPEAGLGFIAAPPKKGKTWIALSLALSVATGKPFLATFQVEKPEPVVYLALEGHRAAIRGRIGALAHGLELQPQGGNDLDNLHLVYKPAGLDLADPAWIRTVRDLVERVGARLIIVDVLRAAAVMKENSNDEFRDLIRALQPLQQAGCAIALLHHFGKLTELSKDRTPGERMAGAGAMYGAFDVGVFITKSDQGARELRIEFETRDLVSPDPLGIHLDGTTTGIAGGFIFADAAAWRVLENAPEDEDTGKFIAWLAAQPDRTATTGEVRYGYKLSDRQIELRRPTWKDAGVIWHPAIGGKPARYEVPVDHPILHHIAAPHDPAPHVGQLHVTQQETLDLQEESEQHHAAPRSTTSSHVNQEKSADLQGKKLHHVDHLYYVEAGRPDGASLDDEPTNPHTLDDLAYLETVATDDNDWTAS